MMDGSLDTRRPASLPDERGRAASVPASVVMPTDARRDAAVARMANERFKLHGLSLLGDAMRAVLAHVSRAADVDERDAVDAVLKHLSRAELASGVVTRETIENALEEMRAEGEIDAVGAEDADMDDPDGRAGVSATHDALMMQHTEGLIVCDAFKTKRYAYDPQRRTFDENVAPSKIECAAESKIDLYRDRFLLLQQRLARSRKFERSTLRTTDRRGIELSSIQSLLGSQAERRFIAGSLSQLEDGRFHMEDLTGTVRVDLTACERSAGLFTENCVVIAEGEVRPDGVFEVIELMFPPSESREATRNATNALDFFGAGHILRPNELEELEKKEHEREGEMFIVLSDVWLDQQRTFDRLEKMFEAYDAQDDVPGLIVFMGDFTSTPFGSTHCDFTAYRDGFDRLADLLEEYPRLRQESRFVFVPGPGDPGLNAALPRPGLQPSLVGALAEKVPRARFASNPAKIRYFSQDLVFFRDDLQAKMRRNCLIPPDDAKAPEDGAADGGASDAVFKHLAATLVQQAHLCPLPMTQNPIYWEYDHALWLYPAPNGIFLGDRTGRQAVVNFEQTSLANPGCFADDGSFLVYRPAYGTVEFSAVP